MRKLLFSLLAFAMLAAISAPQPAAAIERHWGNHNARRFSRTHAWHRGYYYSQWGTPVALVVPPTANMSRRMGWGVSQTSVMPIYHQFERPYPGPFAGSGVGFRATPRWPSHTDQFGVYYVRGPW